MEAQKKGSVGEFSFWLAGKNAWEVRNGKNEVIATRENLSDAFRECQRQYNMKGTK